MIRLRTFKPCDFIYIPDWLQSENEFLKWSGGTFDYPLNVDQIKKYYDKFENDSNSWSFSALNDNGDLIGHIAMKNADFDNKSIHICFVVISPEFRGNGYGKQLILKALDYIFNVLEFDKATINVFENNPSAHNCYLSCGFTDNNIVKNALTFNNEKWNIIEMSIKK